MVGEPDGYDTETQTPAGRLFRLEGQARGAGLHPTDTRLRVAETFGKDQHRLVPEQRRHRRREGLVVPPRLAREVLRPVDRQRRQPLQHVTQERRLEQRRSGQRSHPPAGDLHHRQPVHQAVRVVGDDQDRPIRNGATQSADLVEPVERPRGCLEGES